jgi:hypothetical protein
MLHLGHLRTWKHSANDLSLVQTKRAKRGKPREENYVQGLLDTLDLSLFRYRHMCVRHATHTMHIPAIFMTDTCIHARSLTGMHPLFPCLCHFAWEHTTPHRPSLTSRTLQETGCRQRESRKPNSADEQLESERQPTYIHANACKKRRYMIPCFQQPDP